MGNQCAGGDFNEEKTEKYEYTTEMNINRKKNLEAQSNNHNENFNPHQQASVPERLSSKGGVPTMKPQPQGQAGGVPVKTQAQPQASAHQQFGEVSRQNLVPTAKGAPQQSQQVYHQQQQQQQQQPQYLAAQALQTQQREHLRPGVTVLNSIPDYSNEFTREVLDRLGEFNYNEHEPEVQRKLQEFKGLPTYGPVEMENAALYMGQWKNGQRHGKGKQIWSDGSQYEGFWANDMANFRGRLIHSDGDVYEGLWLNDKVGINRKLIKIS